jgi:large subunit ribosomal protein L30
MEKLKITLVRSLIGRPEDQRATVRALGLRKMHHSVMQDASPAVLGMLHKVRHLVQVEKAEA